MYLLPNVYVLVGVVLRIEITILRLYGVMENISLVREARRAH